MKWEYTFFNLDLLPTTQGMRDLNDLGREGWELVAVYGIWGILKRPVQQPKPDNEWISVEDRLPDPTEEVSVIGYDEDYHRIGEVKLTDWEPKRLIFVDSDDCSITHWQSFPGFGEDQ